MTDQPPHSATHDVFVANLPYDTTHDELHALGAEYGVVVNVHIVTDRETGRAKGYAFIRYRLREDAERCIEALDGFEFKGRLLRPNWGKRRKDSTG